MGPIFTSIETQLKEDNLFKLFLESYFTPLCLYAISAFLIPYFIYRLTSFERAERKSAREESILNKTLIFMVLNSIFLPLFNLTAIIASLSKQEMGEYGKDVTQRIVNSTEFFLRYLVQILFLSNCVQMLALPYFANQKFRRWVNDIGGGEERFEFRTWFFDIGYSVSFSVSVFMQVILFSTTVPLITCLGTSFFLLKYYVDKYNLIFVYPMSFRSQGGIMGTMTIKFLLYAVLFF